MYSRFRIGTIVTAVALLLFALRLFHTSLWSTSPSDGHFYSYPHDFPRKIWQTWSTPTQELDEERMGLSDTWLTMNQDYRYELLTDNSSLTYVRDRFRDRPDIVRTFEQTTDTIFRADLVRYLALLADGGVYTDIDTDCTRPIDDWVPLELAHQTSLVIGIEYDSQGGEVRGDFTTSTQLCQWTLSAKPGHKVLEHVVQRVMAKLEADRNAGVNATSHDMLYVLETTGPRMFTEALLESLTATVGRPISYTDISNLTSPTLFDDVLILPVSAFASGQDHSGSKPWGNDEQLVAHHFMGFHGWKTTHEGKL